LLKIIWHLIIYFHAALYSLLLSIIVPKCATPEEIFACPTKDNFIKTASGQRLVVNSATEAAYL